MINFKKYGYKVILEGIIAVPTQFLLDKAYYLSKDQKDYFLIYNESLMEDIFNMTGKKPDDKDIIDKIVPYSKWIHYEYIEAMLDQNGAKMKLRESILASLLD